MIFNTFAYYLLFLIPSAVTYRVVPPAWRAPVVAFAGAAFFVFFSLTTVGGAAGAACLLLFLWEAVISRWYRPGSMWCVVGVALSLLILGAFKYWNFFTDLASGGPTENAWHWKGAFLPLGISFFTFEFIHYAVDRYKGRTEAGSFWQYLAFILFFPTMVAGPIKRYQDFLPALRDEPRDWVNDWERGITRILVGLVKKFAIADVATSLTARLNPSDIAAAERWVLPIWLLAYGIQIYFDFSGYSDIAIGSGRLFGLRVKENFDWPYLQTNIAAFWQHWHISLYRWLVDYVFIPLGGSRGSPAATLRNVILTMLVSGLWHGAALHFLAWGLWHGLLLTIHRLWVQLRPPPVGPPSRLARGAAWALTFTSVTAGWAFFVLDVPTALHLFKRILLG